MTEKDLDIAIEKCERIMEFDTRTMKNPESENGWLFDKVYDLLQFLRQLQFAEDTNVPTTDTISRQAAIDALEKVADMFPWRVPGNRDTYDRYNEAWNDAIGRAEMEIENMPSAQPEIIHCKDCKYNPNPPECGNAACVLFYGMTDQMGFCHHGERREREC